MPKSIQLQTFSKKDLLPPLLKESRYGLPCFILVVAGPTQTRNAGIAPENSSAPEDAWGVHGVAAEVSWLLMTVVRLDGPSINVRNPAKFNRA
jgi:hypothetical protein